MKKPSLAQLFALVFVGFVAWGAFSVSYANAFVYSQLFDATQYVARGTTYQVIGEFTTTAANTFNTTDDYVQAQFNFTGVTGTSHVEIEIFYATTTCIGLSSLCSTGQVGTFWNLGAFSGTSDQTILLKAAGGFTLPAGSYYIVYSPNAGGVDPQTKIVTNSYSAMFGFISEGTNGASGFSYDPTLTNAAFATTTTQQWCNQNFATSTGFLDSIGQSISLGFCNVGVFLFAPDPSVLSQWQTVASTTRERIPFSYYYDMQNLLEDATATSTENFSPLSIDLHSLGIASTSPMGNILPTNTDILSKETISEYLPSGMHDLLFLLARSAIWFVVLLHLYRRIRPHHATI